MYTHRDTNLLGTRRLRTFKIIFCFKKIMRQKKTLQLKDRKQNENLKAA